MTKWVVLQVATLISVMFTAQAQEPSPNMPFTTMEDFGIYQIIATYRFCSQSIPGFEAEIGSDYEKWRGDNAEDIGRIEAMSWVSEQLATLDERVAANESPSQFTKKCARLEEYLKERSMPIDPRLSSPEATWKLWVDALRNNDRGTALRCLTGTARRNWGAVLKSSDAVELREIADNVESMTLTEERSGPFQEGVVRLKSGTVNIATFLLTPRGEWKIRDM